MIDTLTHGANGAGCVASLYCSWTDSTGLHMQKFTHSYSRCSISQFRDLSHSKKKSFFKTTLCSFLYTENPLLVLSKCILLMYIWYIHSSMYCTVCNSEEKQCPLLPAWLSLCSRPQIETLLQVLLQFTVWRLALCVCGLSAFCSGQPLGWVAGPLE